MSLLCAFMCMLLNSLRVRVCVCVCDYQETQNEAHYLRQHRAELIEELAKTIVQKVSHKKNPNKTTRHKHSPCLRKFINCSAKCCCFAHGVGSRRLHPSHMKLN